MCCPKRGQTTLKYLAITAQVAGANHFNGFFADGFGGAVIGRSRFETERELAIVLAELALEGQLPAAVAQSLQDVPAAHLEGNQDPQAVWIEPAKA
jgi:hypothetical protein